MSTSLSLTRLRRPSVPFNISSPFLIRLLSGTTTQAPRSNPHFPVQYLIQTWGLPSDEASRASKSIQHLKSPDKPDAVLRFLRQTGVRDSDIRTAVSRDPRLLCSNVEKNLRPNVAKLREVGLSTQEISGMVSRSPCAFLFNIVPKVDFWMRALGSVEHVSFLLTRRAGIVNSNLEKVIIPNLSFLQDECGLSVRQIARVIRIAPFMIQSRMEALKILARRAEELGVPRKKPMFLYALMVVRFLNESAINVKLHCLRSFGLSHEVAVMIGKAPQVLLVAEETMRLKMEFLLKDAGCDKMHVIRNPTLLTYSLEKRLIPRSIVRKLLMSRGVSVANRVFASFIQKNEKQFVVKFVLPYEHAIPGLHRAYADACAGKLGLLNSLSIS